MSETVGVVVETHRRATMSERFAIRDFIADRLVKVGDYYQYKDGWTDRTIAEAMTRDRPAGAWITKSMVYTVRVAAYGHFAPTPMAVEKESRAAALENRVKELEAVRVALEDQVGAYGDTLSRLNSKIDDLNDTVSVLTRQWAKAIAKLDEQASP
jgi:2-keto-4-pentenoate hydratase